VEPELLYLLLLMLLLVFDISLFIEIEGLFVDVLVFVESELLYLLLKIRRLLFNEPTIYI